LKTKIWYAIGLMSGTSLDGVDIAFIEFTFKKTWEFKILKSKTYSYSKDWLLRLKKAFHSNKTELKKIDIEYGDYLADLINSFITTNKITNIDFIASHGHTIHHQPEKFSFNSVCAPAGTYPHKWGAIHCP